MFDDTLSLVIFAGQFNVFGGLLKFKISGYGGLVIFSGLVLYTLYIKRLLTRDELPPISSWGLWLLLDVVAIGAEASRNVFNLQLVMYTIGSLVICLVLLYKYQQSGQGFVWSKMWDKTWDTITAVAVLIAVVVWYLNPTIGLVVSLLGMTIASVPLICEVIKGMDEPIDAWIVATVGSFISYFDGSKISAIWLGILQLVVVVLIFRFSKREVKA